jgi:hypothetical protein
MLSRASGKIIRRSNLLWITLVYLSSWMQAIVICHPVLWLARCLLRLWKNPAFEPKFIILAIEKKFRYQISYGKAFMEKKNVMEMRWVTYETSYDNLPRLLNTIATLNPGSYYDIKTYNLVSRPGKQVLQRAFLALGPAIAAFKQCRPIICIDGTFLIGKYKDTILTAVAADGNNQLLPLAIAFAERENGDCWYWFL